MHVKEAHERHSLRMGRCCLEHKERAAGQCQGPVKIEMCISRSTGCYCKVCVFYTFVSRKTFRKCPVGCENRAVLTAFGCRVELENMFTLKPCVDANLCRREAFFSFYL